MQNTKKPALPGMKTEKNEKYKKQKQNKKVHSYQKNNIHLYTDRVNAK